MYRWFVVALGLVLGGCATYQAQDLPARGTDAPHLTDVQPAVDAVPGLHHLYHPQDGLDADELAMLAVANNPRLRAARSALHVNEAQVFAAGLLADPQLGVTNDLTMTPGTSNAWALGLGFDVGDWLMRSSRRSVAQDLYQQNRQNLLWQEWQVVNMAHLLFVRAQADAAALNIQQREAAMLAQAAQASRHALQAGNVSQDVANADWLAWQMARQKLSDRQQRDRQTQADLHNLLGIAPGDEIHLQGQLADMPVDRAQIQNTMQGRLAERPDLRALRAGYQAQDDVYRAGILAQFPMLGVGLSRAQDNTQANSAGFGLTLSLPIFNRNRGNIAVAKASRQQLYDEYQTRWQESVNEILQALDNMATLQHLSQTAVAQETQLKAQAVATQAALVRGDVAGPDALRMQLALLDRQLDQIAIHQALVEQRIALDTLMGPQASEWR